MINSLAVRPGMRVSFHFLFGRQTGTVWSTKCKTLAIVELDHELPGIFLAIDLDALTPLPASLPAIPAVESPTQTNGENL